MRGPHNSLEFGHDVGAGLDDQQRLLVLVQLACPPIHGRYLGQDVDARRSGFNESAGHLGSQRMVGGY